MREREMGECDVAEELRGLRETVRALEAPVGLEARLLAAFRAHVSAPRRRPLGLWPLWALAAAAVVVCGLGLYALLQRPLTRPAPLAPPAPLLRTQVAVPPAPPTNRVHSRRPEPLAEAQVSSAFIALVPDVGSRPGESFQVMRVSMPRSALRSFGLPVDEDRAFEMVRADIVVGQDMVARAIRVVR